MDLIICRKGKKSIKNIRRRAQPGKPRCDRRRRTRKCNKNTWKKAHTRRAGVLTSLQSTPMNELEDIGKIEEKDIWKGLKGLLDIKGNIADFLWRLSHGKLKVGK